MSTIGLESYMRCFLTFSVQPSCTMLLSCVTQVRKQKSPPLYAIILRISGSVVESMRHDDQRFPISNMMSTKASYNHIHNLTCSSEPGWKLDQMELLLLGFHHWLIVGFPHRRNMLFCCMKSVRQREKSVPRSSYLISARYRPSFDKTGTTINSTTSFTGVRRVALKHWHCTKVEMPGSGWGVLGIQ